MARKTAACAAAIILLVIFIALLAAYTRPMEDKVYDLSLLPQTEAVPEDWVFDDKGWTVYTRDGNETRPLTPTGTGAYTGLSKSGQTFYLSRVLDEELDAPTLQLGPSESSVAVFLGGELIYGDNVPRDAAVGALRLPMLDTYRADALSISLPADYLGKTLTIAQSTWAVEGVEPGEVMVFPLNVTLYCGFSYESGIIAASFRAAIPAALAFAAAFALLALLVWQSLHGRGDMGLLWAAAALLSGAAAILASADFFSRYFGVEVDVVRLARLLTLAALLAFLASRAGKRRAVLWALTGLYTLSAAACAAVVLRAELVTDAVSAFLAGSLPELLGLASLLCALVMGGVLWRREGRFYALFVPAALAAALIAAVWIAVSTGPGKALRQAVTSLVDLTPGYILWPLTASCLAAAALAAAVHAVQREIARRAELRSMAERERMALESYENMARQHREILMLRHDMKRHLAALRGMVSEPRAAAYIDELTDEAESVPGVVSTGNSMLDILLNSRLKDAQDVGIEPQADRLSAPENLPLTDAELSSLILNILDNAIAAASASGVENPWIKLDCHVKNDFFVFSCENSAAAGWMEKEPAENHGLGKKIIERIMSRHGSLLRAEAGEDSYRVTLAIPLSA